VNYIIFLKARWAFRLKPWQAIDLESHPKIIRALQVLAEGPLSKAALFDRVWGNARYASRLHDPLIWYVLSRIKKLIGANFKTKNGIIESTDGVMIL